MIAGARRWTPTSTRCTSVRAHRHSIEIDAFPDRLDCPPDTSAGPPARRGLFSIDSGRHAVGH